MVGGLGAARDLIRRLGIDVHRHPHVATREGHLRQLLSSQEVDVVLDVGANEGQFGHSLRTDVGFEGRIISFEPDPTSFEVLTSRARADQRWDCWNLALGASDGSARLHQFDYHRWNSLHEPHVENLAEAGRSLSEIGSVDVEVRSLDSIWSSLSLDRSTPFLKIDTQGHELEVLRGAEDRLRQLAGVLAEASNHRFYENEPHLTDLLSWFDAHRWMPSGFFPVVRDQRTLALQQVDVVFVPIAP